MFKYLLRYKIVSIFNTTISTEKECVQVSKTSSVNRFFPFSLPETPSLSEGSQLFIIDIPRAFWSLFLVNKLRHFAEDLILYQQVRGGSMSLEFDNDVPLALATFTTALQELSCQQANRAIKSCAWQSQKHSAQTAWLQIRF